MSPQYSIRIFPGRVSDTTAQLYVQAEVSEAADEYRLSGRINGPHIHNAHTLPASIPFKDLGPGETVLVATVIPDPCVWTPDCPALYDLSLDLVTTAGEVVKRIQTKTGISSFGVYRNSFYLNAKRFVPRLIHESFVGTHSFDELREARLGVFANEPSEDMLLESSRLGVPLMVRATLERLDELAAWPSVFAVLLDLNNLVSPSPSSNRHLSSNRLAVAKVWRGAPTNTDGATNASDEGTDAWIVSRKPEDLTESGQTISALPTAGPIVFATELTETDGLDLKTLRRHCDLLQQQTAQCARGAAFLLVPSSLEDRVFPDD